MRNMNKFGVMFLMTTLFLAACGGDEDVIDQPTDAVTTDAPVASDTVSVTIEQDTTESR